MAYSFRHTNPEMTGVIIKEKVRCGKKNCHCVAGKAYYHKWYHYLYWRDNQNGGVLRKRYIPQGKIKSLKRKIKFEKKRDSAEKLNLRNCLKMYRQMLRDQILED